VGAKIRRPAPDGATQRDELLKAGHAPGSRIVSMAGGVYLAAGTDLGPPAQELAAQGDLRIVAGPGSLDLLLGYLPSVAARTALTGVTVDLGLLTEPAAWLRPIAGLLPMFGVQVEGVEPEPAPAAPRTAPATPAPEPDAEQQYRAGFYDRVGRRPAAEPRTEFARDADGERAELEWSLNTLAGHGVQWLDKGFDFLDAGTPEAREQILIDAIRDAPAGPLRALAGLIRGVDAHPERDMPASFMARAVHLALTGRADEGVRLVSGTWRTAYPSYKRVREAVLTRPTVSAEERGALAALVMALLTC
jgi:hypothetical protein